MRKNILRSAIAALAVSLAAAVGLAQRGAPIAQQLTFMPYHTNGIYNLGETVGWTVTPGPDSLTYTCK